LRPAVGRNNGFRRESKDPQLLFATTSPRAGFQGTAWSPANFPLGIRHPAGSRPVDPKGMRQVVDRSQGARRACGKSVRLRDLPIPGCGKLLRPLHPRLSSIWTLARPLLANQQVQRDSKDLHWRKCEGRAQICDFFRFR